jgi:YD repeat-containing protein
MKILLTLLVVALTSQAHAQQRTFYDARGNVVGRTATDSQGTTKVYDAGGRVVGHESKSGDTKTIYDSSGRKVGQTTKERAR